MSENPAHGASKIRPSKSGDHEGGGGGKWLLGALAAAVLVGGGYYAYTQLPSTQSETQTAYNEGYADDEPLRAGPLDPSDDLVAESAASDEAIAPAAASSEQRTSAPARRTTASADAAAVPEEVIGITPVSATTSDTDDIVVTAPPRPIWAQTPSARRLSALYPSRALDRGREGEAALHCTVLDGGALDCAKVSETPGGGFGNAALRVARNLRHASTTRDGRDAVGTPVNLRVVFRIEDEEGRRG